MKFRGFFVTIIALAMFACGDDKANGDTSAKGSASVAVSDFDSYLKFKRINIRSEQQKQKILDDFNKRSDLAAAIENESLLDKQLINAELDEFKKEMLISRYFEKFLADKVSEQAIANYYNTHASDYESKKVQIAHVLIRTNSRMSPEERKAKLTVAQEVYSKARAGEDFAELAKAYSEDKVSAKKGGDLGWIKEGSIDKRLSKIAFESKINEISEPFETTFGFHVIKVLAEPKIVKKPLKAVSGDIRYQLRNKAKQAELERLIAKNK